MPTFTALTTLAGKDKAEALGAAMEALTPEPTGVGVFELEDGSGLWEVGGYFQGAPDAAGLALLAALHGAKDFVVSELPEVDWVAKVKRELTPVEAGRFFVYGSHDADKVPEGCEPLLIEASMAFGTGHHGTTQGCLQLLEAAIVGGAQPTSVLDLGCGTAVLAMAAARVWPQARVLASDIDAVAVEVAEANVAANGLAGHVLCLEAEGLEHEDILKAAPFDLIFANILKGPLIGLCPRITQALSPQGNVILSGILNEQRQEIADVYTACGNSVVETIVIGDWSSLMLRKSV